MRRTLALAVLLAASCTPAYAQEMSAEQRHNQRAAIDALIIRDLLVESGGLRAESEKLKAEIARLKTDTEKAAKKE